MRVLGISGSLRRDSLNSALLRAAAERLPAGVELVELRAAGGDPALRRGRRSGRPPDAVRELREAMSDADAVLIATPEYNHSIPGQLKNALDWASRPAGKSALNGKPAAAIGASNGMFGAVWAQAELRKVLGAMGGRVIEAELPVGPRPRAPRRRRLELEPEQAEQLEEILAELVAAAERERLGEPETPSRPSRASGGREREERDRREVGGGGGDHEQVEDLVVAEDPGVGVGPLGRVDDGPIV